MDEECPDGMSCYAHTTCLGTDPSSYFCGASFEDASLSCANPCPSGSSDECPDDDDCYAYTPCFVSDAASQPSGSPFMSEDLTALMSASK
jgi:hypothetical protein